MRLAWVHLSRPARHRAFVLPVAVVAAAFMLVISESAYHESAAQLDTLGDMGRSRILVLETMSNVASAESGQRGYLLTGRPEYRKPYDDARQAVGQQFAQLQVELRQLRPTGMEPSRRALLDAIERKLSEMDEVLRLHDAGQYQAARELILSGIGREQMDVVRSRSADLVAAQSVAIGAGRDYLLDTMRLTRIGIACMTVLSLLLLMLFLRVNRRLEAARDAQAAQVKAERDRLEQEVMSRTDDLTELARHLETAREDERAHLARELHDELGALLTAAKLDVARIRPKLQLNAPEQLERLTHLNETLNSGIALKRRIIEDLRPSTLDNLGLKAALEILLAEFGERTGVRVLAELEDVSLGASAQLTAYRLIQESLTNVTKYARATEVQVTLVEQAGQAMVGVADNGVGFDLSVVPRGRHGLLGMRYRVESEAGKFQVRASVGGGTQVTAALPLATSAQSDKPTRLTPMVARESPA